MFLKVYQKIIILVFMSLLVQKSLYANNNRKEVQEKRGYHSKTYLNPDGAYTAEISAGFVHYKNDKGDFEEINRNIVSSSAQDYDYEVTSGLYHAYFKARLDDSYPVVFETRGGAGLVTELYGMGYIDNNSKKFHVIETVRPTQGKVNKNEILYEEAFTDVDIKYFYTDTRLKEEIYLTQQARDNLPDPEDYGLKSQKTSLVFIMKLNANMPTIAPFANGNKVNMASFEGEEKIEFKDLRGNIQFFLPVDMAFVKSSFDSVSIEESIPIKRRFFKENDETFLLASVPLSWIFQQPSGTIVFDPTITISPPTHDVWIENSSTKKSYNFIIAGKHAGNDKKRMLVKFDIDDAGIPQNADVESADLKLYYYTIYGYGSWIDRPINVNQLLVDWHEDQATRDVRLTGTSWDTAYAAIDGRDAKADAEDMQTINNSYPKWVTWNLTDLAEKWIQGTAGNHGVIMWATNENTDSYDLRFKSSEAGSDERPRLEVTYTEQTASSGTTYYVRDAAGNVIATYTK